MKIAIILTGHAPDSIRDKYPDYAVMFEKMLHGKNGDYVFSNHAIVDGDALPEISQFDGALVTGSAYGV